MSMLDGFSQCWPLGEKCWVWWDAWAVVVACIAIIVGVCTLVVAIWGAFATMVSGGAVAWLGYQANQLAKAGQTTEDRREQFAADQLSKERDREESVVLAFVYAEVNDLHASLTAISEGTTKGHYTADDMVRSTDKRNELVDCARWLKTDRLTQCFPRFHQLNDDHGLRLARLLSLAEYVRVEIESLRDEVSPAEIKDPDHSAGQEKWIRTTFVNISTASTEAVVDADFCLELSSAALAMIGKRPASSPD